MSGEKTKKAEEVWYRLSLDRDFLSDLKKIKKNYKKYSAELLFQGEFLFKKYNTIPTVNLRNLFLKYILGNKHDIEKERDYPAGIQTPTKAELDRYNRGMVKIMVFDGVSRDELIDYIKKSWKNIKTLIKSQEKEGIKRIRTSNKEIGKELLEYNKLTTKDLKKLAGFPNEKTYRYILIHRLMSKKGFKTTPDSIKSALVRLNKKSRNKA